MLQRFCSLRAIWIVAHFAIVRSACLTRATKTEMVLLVMHRSLTHHGRYWQRVLFHVVMRYCVLSVDLVRKSFFSYKVSNLCGVLLQYAQSAFLLPSLVSPEAPFLQTATLSAHATVHCLLVSDGLASSAMAAAAAARPADDSLWTVDVWHGGADKRVHRLHTGLCLRSPLYLFDLTHLLVSACGDGSDVARA
jgi:hypothetical protein